MLESIRSRRVLIPALVALAAVLAVIGLAPHFGLLAGTPWAGAAVLILAAVCASAIDGGGNVHFLRAVHPFERNEMTAVFTTYRHIGQLGVPALYSAILQVLQLPVVFIASGVSMVVLAYYSHYIPRRM